MGKKISFAVLLFVILMCIVQCENKKEANATIIGYDLTLTPCSGGLIIDHQDGKIYQWEDLQNNFGIDDSTKYPLKVYIEFIKKATPCSRVSGWIDIQDMEY